MENSQKPKYPARLFWFGFFLNLIKRPIILLPTILLLIIGIWNQTCLNIGLALLITSIIFSFVEQLVLRHATLTSDDPALEELRDTLGSSNWHNDIIDLINSKIKESDSEDKEP